MKSYRIKRALCLMLALFALSAAAPAFAAGGAAGNTALIYPVAFGRTRLTMLKDGTFTKDKTPSAAKVGETERFAVALMSTELAASGEEAVVTITSEGYDFSACEPVLLIPVDNVYYARKLSDFTADKNSLTVDVRVEYLGVNAASPVYLYFAPKKTAESPEVALKVSRKTEDEFAFGQSIVIGDYTIEKQGGDMPVEIALGMANMDEKDTVYIVTDSSGKEVLRLVVHDGELYGIALKDNGIVVSLEYSFKKKAYVSVISGKELLKKDVVVSVFRQLGISFTNPPDEQEWLKTQIVYSTVRKIKITGQSSKTGS